MKISTKGRYALRLMLDVALHDYLSDLVNGALDGVDLDYDVLARHVLVDHTVYGRDLT